MRGLTVTVGLAISFLVASAAEARQTGTISGTLTDAVTSVPLTGNAFVVYAYSLGGGYAGSGSADAAGHYQILSLNPGTYFVKVSMAPGYVTELHDNITCIAAACQVTSGTPVTLAVGATVTIDFALAREGIFTGSVRRASDGSRIFGLYIHVYDASTSLVKTLWPEADGTYTVRGLLAGTYFARTAIETSSPPPSFDYVTEIYGGLPCLTTAFVHDCPVALGTPIVVTEGATTTGIDFALDPAGSISGTVVCDGTQEPLANVPVQAFAGDVARGSATTNGSGQYTIVGLVPGAYRVRTNVVEGNFVNEWHNDVYIGCVGAPAAVALGSGASVGGIDFSLATGGALSGRFQCGAINAALSVEAYNSAGILVRGFRGGHCTGNFLIEGLPADQYYVLVRDVAGIPYSTIPSPGMISMLYGDVPCVTADCDVRRGVPVPVSAGTTTTVDFTPVPGARSGRIDISLRVSVFDARGVQLVNVVRSGDIPAYQQIAGLPPGTYFVKAGDRLHDGIACVDCPPTSGTPIVIRPGDFFFEVNFGTLPGQAISGTVRDVSGGAPLSASTVELLSETGQVVRVAVSDLFGRYRLEPVTPGTYFARTRNDRGYVDELYAELDCVTCDPRMGTPISVVSGSDVTGLDFTLAAGGVVSGSVTDTAGVALGNVPVSLFDDAGSLVGRTMASAAGQFRLTLPSGSYRARAEATATAAAELFSELPCTSGACDVASGTPISVTTGALTSNINFTLVTCSAMTLSPPLLASGVTGRAYRQVLSVSGGSGPMAYQVTTGVLPLGLTLDSATGVLSGTPEQSGRQQFTVAVLDANACATARAYTLDVQSCAFTLSPLSATLPAAGGTVTVTINDTCGSQAVTDTGTFVTVQSNTPGQVVLLVDPNSAAPRVRDITIGRRVFTVRQAGAASQPPFGWLDTPLDFAEVNGSIAVSGWALDDLEVRRVLIFRDPIASEPATPLFVGAAVFVPGARPDVQRSFPTYPFNDRAGWGFLILTNMLPNQGNGTFRIYAYAEDAEGGFTLLGARTIVATNATATLPFGAIDTPAQGETIAGSEYLNWGWALTPQPKMIPTDGSTIHVYVDGAPLGAVTYNLFRPDVSGLFPGLANSGGPVGYRVIDTTALAEGLHTISWTVTDDQGAGAGIGSRYFSVANSADAQPTGQGSAAAAPWTNEQADPSAELRARPIAVVPGPDSSRHTASLAGVPVHDAPVTVRRDQGAVRRLRVSDDESRVISLAPLERLELTLGGADAACLATWAGYLVAKDRLRDLPVGAALDSAGTFYWQPGPGFAGGFELLFVRTACDGTKTKVPLTVTIQGR